MDTFFVLDVEDCIPQMPSTPHGKASVQDRKKGWP